MWFWVIFIFTKQFLGDILQLCMIVFVSYSYSSQLSWSLVFFLFFARYKFNLLYCLDWSNAVDRFLVYVKFVTFLTLLLSYFMIIVRIIIFNFSKQFLGWYSLVVYDSFCFFLTFHICFSFFLTEYMLNLLNFLCIWLFFAWEW